jgi:hypothetical protein
MRFLTRQWHRGGLSDAESDAVVEAYRRHLEALLPVMPATVRELAQWVSLHDGRFRGAQVHRSAGTLTLELRCGDLQRGYFDVDLTCGGVNFASSTLADLAAAVRNTKSECLADEIDTADDGSWLHRILIDPDREVTIAFGTLNLHVSPRPDRGFKRRSEPYVELRAVNAGPYS